MVPKVETEVEVKDESKLEGEEEKPEKNPPPSLETFLNYAIENKENVSKSSVELKYKSWVENGWKDGNGKKVTNWKSKLLNTLSFLPEDKEKGSAQNKSRTELAMDKIEEIDRIIEEQKRNE